MEATFRSSLSRRSGITFSATSSYSDRAPVSNKRNVPLWQKVMKILHIRTEQDQAKLIIGIVLFFWIALSVVFTYVYNYEPLPVFRIPQDMNVSESVCLTNQSCLFAIGGAYAILDSFLPAVEAFYNSNWGSEEILPQNDQGGYGEGVSTYAAVLGNKIYLVGHKGFGYMFSYDGNEVDGRWWTPEPRMGHPREGFALAVFRGRIYAIAGKTLCQPQSLQENPQSTCLPGMESWMVTGPQAALPTSVGVESIDPRTERQWRTECFLSGLGVEGNASRCLQIPRSGASAAVFRDLLYIVGGYYGGVVEVYDGQFWSTIGPAFPFGLVGATAITFNDRLWIFGGFSYAQYLDTSIVFDGNVWVAESQLLVARAWGAGAVLNLSADYCTNLDGWLPGDPCQRVFLVGGVSPTSAIASVESFDGQEWSVEAPLLNRRGRLAAVAFSKQPPAIAGR